MAIRLDAQELHELLRLTPATQNIMLIGRHGIGKSEIITEFYRRQGMKVIAFFLGQMSDPGDLIGLLHKDETSGRSVFLPPYWWPQPNEPIVLFLDELNRARPEILQAVHDLALNKRLAGKQLPAGSMVIAAVNEGDEYQLTELDPALVSRFNLYEFAPTVEEWLVWASNHDVDERVITFIQKHHHHLDGERVGQEEAMQHAGLVKLPDRRSWVRVSDFIKHSSGAGLPAELDRGGLAECRTGAPPLWPSPHQTQRDVVAGDRATQRADHALAQQQALRRRGRPPRY